MKITSNLILRKALILSAIFFLTVLFSCKKDGKLTPDFDSNVLSVQYVDTFSITSTVDTVLPLRTDLSVYSLLGLYNDSIFGPVSSSIYSQIVLTGANVDFGNNIMNPTICDSIVLNLPYQEIYGDLAASMTVEVYELSSPIDANIDYYSDMTIAHKPTLLATKTFVPNTAEDLRIKLSPNYGDSILANSPFTDNAVFTSLFNGLYITVKDSVTGTTIPIGSGSIAYFNMNTTSARLSLYYHQNDLESGVQQYDFTINSEAKKFSHFEHNYTGTDIEAHLNSLPTRDSTRTYVSTMAGVTTKLLIPNIKDLSSEGNVIINKAELIVTVESGTEGSFDDPLSSISLVGIDVNGDSFFLPDFFESQNYYGGTIVDDGNFKTYTFNIARHIHDLVYNTPIDYGLYLLANGSSISANRVVLGSEYNPITKIQLNITYSKF